MKLKINKEMILKNRFWIILGVAVTLILAGTYHLQMNVSAEAEKGKIKKTLDEVKKTLAAGTFQSPATIKERVDDAKRAKDLEAIVWSKAYKAQENLFKWPAKVEEKFNFQNGRFALDIKIDNLITNKEEWPADSESLIHGTLIDQQSEWFKIQDRKGEEVKFFVTGSTEYVTVVGQPKAVLFAQIPRDFRSKKLFAVSFQTGRYFNDPLTAAERVTFANSYKSQIYDILREVDPLDGNTGVVQFKGWQFRRDDPQYLPDEKATFFRYVTEPWKLNIDFSAEAWIAQENLWIQREIYQIIRRSNDTISKFYGKKGEKRGEDYVFKNSNFELTLKLLKDSSLSFTIKNLQSKRQPLDLKFRVQLNEGFQPEEISPSGLPLEPAGVAKKDSYTQIFPVTNAVRKGIYHVEQVLTWDIAAVKRIDHITIGSNSGDELSHSHRTFPEGLRALEVAEVKVEDKGNIGGAPPPQFGMPPRGQPAMGLGANKGMFIPGHGLWRDRYFEVSEQSRRVPVGIVLIVDQAHVDRVLTAFNNSKLRFLDTQVLLNHYAGSVQPVVAEKVQEGGNIFQLDPRKGGEQPRPASESTGSAGQETNMELVIYGIMTLYQRYPPRPPMEKQP